MTETFGQRLKRLRLAKGLTQQQVSAAVGIKRDTYDLQEEGLQECLASTLSRLADALGVSMDYLYRGEDPAGHAHWKSIRVVDPDDRGNPVIGQKTCCSRCGKTNKHYTPPYCPHCGAAMDEEVTDA